MDAPQVQPPQHSRATERIYQEVQLQIEKGKRSMIEEVTNSIGPAIETGITRALYSSATAQSLSKKFKQERPLLAFNKPHLKIRYEANDNILSTIEEAIDLIDTEQIEAAKNSINEGEKLLEIQQQFLRLADREEHGWEVVKQYQNDELAANSDNEKAIDKARKAAATEVAKRKTRKTKEKFRNVPFPTYDSRCNIGHRGQGGGASRRYNHPRPGFGRSGAVCYRYGRVGHMKHSCPRGNYQV